MISDSIIKRAFKIAKKEEQEITKKNANIFIIKALKEENKMIINLIDTYEGGECLKIIRNNIMCRVYDSIRKKDKGVKNVKNY